MERQLIDLFTCCRASREHRHRRQQLELAAVPQDALCLSFYSPERLELQLEA